MEIATRHKSNLRNRIRKVSGTAAASLQSYLTQGDWQASRVSGPPLALSTVGSPPREDVAGMNVTIEYAYRRFAVRRFPLPSEEQLVEVERQLGVRLPEEYREYILDFNGGYF